jgi:hypothetical protein
MHGLLSRHGKPSGMAAAAQRTGHDKRTAAEVALAGHLVGSGITKDCVPPIVCSADFQFSPRARARPAEAMQSPGTAFTESEFKEMAHVGAKLRSVSNGRLRLRSTVHDAPPFKTATAIAVAADTIAARTATYIPRCEARTVFSSDEMRTKKSIKEMT